MSAMLRQPEWRIWSIPASFLFCVMVVSGLLPIKSEAVGFNSAPARFWGHVYGYKDMAPSLKVESPRLSNLEGEIKSEWRVSYVGFPADAKNAVQHAIDIWARNFKSEVPIQVEATWEDNPNKVVLGSARPGYYFNSFDGSPNDELWYPSAIANTLAGRDLNPSQKEIYLNVNSSPLWYTGIDGLPGPRSYDLVSVVLHEIAHGLGFLSNAEYDRYFGTGYMYQPTPYDSYVQLPDGRSLADFCSRSLDLGKAMLGPLYWSGEFGLKANGGVKPKLYTPTPYEEGSSITHLDEVAFAKSIDNSLMTPNLAPGEVLRNPGPLVLAMIEDMKRKPPLGRANGVPTKLLNPRALVGDSFAILNFSSTSCSRVDQVTSYEVTILPEGITRTYRETPIKVRGLKNGKIYKFSIVAANELGKSEPVETNQVRPQRSAPVTTIDAFARVSEMATITYKGRSTIVYGDENSQTLKIAQLIGKKWQIKVIRRGIEVGPISICKSGTRSREALHVFYGELRSQDLLYSNLSGAKWVHERVDGDGEDVQDYREQLRRRTASNVSVSNACAVTNSGLQVFYRDDTQGILLGAVKAKDRWNYEIVDGDKDTSNRTTGDVAFSIAAVTEASSNSIYLVYDSVLRVDSNKLPTEGEVRIASRRSIFPEDWRYQTIDGPDEGNAVAGFATNIARIRGKVIATWFVSRGEDFPFPTHITYATLGEDLIRKSIAPIQLGRPALPLSIDYKGIVFGCTSGICTTDSQKFSSKLLSGKGEFSKTGHLMLIWNSRYFVTALNRKLVLVKADV